MPGLLPDAIVMSVVAGVCHKLTGHEHVGVDLEYVPPPAGPPARAGRDDHYCFTVYRVSDGAGVGLRVTGDLLKTYLVNFGAEMLPSVLPQMLGNLMPAAGLVGGAVNASPNVRQVAGAAQFVGLPNDQREQAERFGVNSKTWAAGIVELNFPNGAPTLFRVHGNGVFSKSGLGDGDIRRAGFMKDSLREHKSGLRGILTDRTGFDFYFDAARSTLVPTTQR